MRTTLIAFAALSLSVGATDAATYTKAAAAGKPVILYQATSVHPDCSATGAVTMKVLVPPEHGRVTFQRTGVFPTFSSWNVRERCNTRRVPGIKAIYTSQRGYQGIDRAAIEVIFPAGGYQRHAFGIVVR
jgi:hypothetical protein